MNEQTVNTTPETPSSEPPVNSTAAFLFDEPNPVFEAVTDSGAAAAEPVAPTAPVSVSDFNLAGLAEVDKPTVVNTPVVPQAQPVVPAVQQQQQAQPNQQVAPNQQQQQTPQVPLLVPDLSAVLPTLPVLPQQQQPQQVAPVQQQQQVPAQQYQQQLSQEEINRSLNVYQMSEKDYDSIFATDDKQQSIQALNQVLQNAVRQAVTMSHVLVTEQVQNLQQTVSPYMQFADQQRTSALEQTFYQMHPDLVSARPVVDAVTKKLKEAGYTFSDASQLFDAVAQNTKAYLSKLTQAGHSAIPTQNGQVQGQVVMPSQGAKPPMASLPSGGTSGAGGNGAGGAKMNTAQRLFG